MKKLMLLMLLLPVNAFAQGPQIEEPIPYSALPVGIVSEEVYDKVIEQSRKNPFDTFYGSYWHWVASFYTLQVQGAEILRLNHELNKLKPVITDFLWKPVAENGGKVAVLASLENLDVYVESADGTLKEKFRNTGPSNGYGTTARSSYTCQEWGDKAKLSFKQNGIDVVVFTNHRMPVVQIDHGCSRIEGHDN